MVISRRWQTEAGLASGKARFMGGAIDPIDAAKDDIAGSKDLIASVSDDLSQHYRWLENYRSSEIRHARRLKRQEVMFELGVQRHRFMRLVKRAARNAFQWLRAAALSLGRMAKAAVLYLYSLLARGMRWAAPKVGAAGAAIGRRMAAIFAWLGEMLGAFVRIVARIVVIGFVWLVLEFRALLLTLGKWLTVGWTWVRVEGGALARATLDATAVGLVWLGETLAALARATLKAAAIAIAWLAEKSWDLTLALLQSLAAGFALILILAGRLSRAIAKGAALAFAWLAATGKALALVTGRALSRFVTWFDRQMEALTRAMFGVIALVSARIARKSRQISRLPRPDSPALLPPPRPQILEPIEGTALVRFDPAPTAIQAIPTDPQETVPSPPSPGASRIKKAKRKSPPRKRPVNSRAGRASP